MRNFDTDLDTAISSEVRSTAMAVKVTETVTVTPRPTESRTFVGKAEGEWDWSDLRDYVVVQIEQRFGSFPRDAKKESGIFKSFLTRYGAKAPAIAKYVFESEGGYWLGAPVGVNRFCRGSDPYFGDVISERLVDSPVAAW